MKPSLALLLCLAIPFAALAFDKEGFKIDYDGGSVQGIKAGKSLRLVVQEQSIKLMNKSEPLVTIPSTSVTELSYGQDVHRRVGAAIGLALVSFGLGALMALTKSKKHFIGVTWDDSGKKGGFAVQADKSDYRGLLAALEGVTGKKAVNSETATVKN